MKNMPRLSFKRKDVILNIDKTTDRDALLYMATAETKDAKRIVNEIKTSFSDEEIDAALYEAAKKIKKREKVRAKRRLNREFAWRVGYYLAISLGTAKNYPMEP